MNRILESKLNSASRSPNSAQRFLRKRFRSLDRSRWKLNTTLSMDRVGNSTQRSLWIALETQHNAFLRVALETQHNAFLRVALWSRNSVLQRICRNSHRFNIKIQILVGKVMVVSVLLSFPRIDPFRVN
ncbi:hypothetical protein MAL06_16765 [Leptospira noguchii]|nr:hypothetical protein [Leptospira noguchii]UOG30214.1 hypothetical protein MAL06_16765 [Leptospira noguchii]